MAPGVCEAMLTTRLRTLSRSDHLDLRKVFQIARPMDQPTPTSSKGRRIAFIVLGLGISVLFIGLVLHDLSFEQLADEIGKVNLAVLTLVIPLDLLGFLCLGGRTHVLFNVVSESSYRQSLKSVLLGYAGNNTLPLRAGEFLRVGYLSRVGPAPSSSCLTLVGFERVFDIVVILVLFLVAVSVAAVSMTTSGLLWTLVPVVATALVGLVAINVFSAQFVALARRLGGIFGERAADYIGGLAQNVADGLAVLDSPAKTLLIVGLTLGNWIMTALSIYVWFVAFDLSLPWYAPLLLIGFISFGNLLPSSPANVGTFHFFVVEALVLLGITKAMATSVAIVGHVAGTLPFTIVGIIWCFADFVRGIGSDGPAVSTASESRDASQ